MTTYCFTSKTNQQRIASQPLGFTGHQTSVTHLSNKRASVRAQQIKVYRMRNKMLVYNESVGYDWLRN